MARRFKAPDPAPNPDDPSNITEDRAARRYHQMRRLERRVNSLDQEIVSAQTDLKALKEQREAAIDELLAAARDEGDLPLFDLD
jgi:predicted  nucleic acid-binding Zn-ribbon protein